MKRPLFLIKPKFSYIFSKSFPLDLILNKMNAVHVGKIYLLKFVLLTNDSLATLKKNIANMVI
jgi:hypothetical protein